MATIKVLKVGTNGVPTEQATTDEALFQDYTVTSPSTHGLKPTGTEIAFDSVMAIERDNTMTTAGAVLFPTISDSAGQVDALRLPQLAGTPTATPTASGEGFLVWNSTTNKLYAWDGATWINNFVSASSANNIDNDYTAAAGGLTARQVVYISAADTVDAASNAATGTSQAFGFNTSGVVAGAGTATIRSSGTLGGFSGLTSGAMQYLSTAGAMTETVPAGSGASIVRVGYAKNTTTVSIQFDYLGIRA